MLNKIGNLILLFIFMLFAGCLSKSGHLKKPEVDSGPSITQWVSNGSEGNSDSTGRMVNLSQASTDHAASGMSNHDVNGFFVNEESSSTAEEGSVDIIEGKVIGILDGDTFDLLTDSNRTVRIRMEGIDAPEKGMPFYQVSKRHLGSLCFGQRIAVHITRVQSGNRKIGFIYLPAGTELCHEMISAGLAWHFVKYNSDQDLAELEQEARRAHRGLWKDPNPFPPWEIRKIRRSGQSTKELFNIPEDQR